MILNIIARFLLVLGGLMYLVQSLSSNEIFTTKYPIVFKSIAFLIGISALYFIFDRDYYLPFLGKTVIPIISTRPATENLKKVNLVNLPPDARIIYWAAKSSSKESDWKVYNNYSNSGVSITDKDGNATIQIECPLEYNIPSLFGRKRLKRHVHYRYEIPGYAGMFSKVYTTYIDSC